MDKLEDIKKKIPEKKKPHLTRRSTKTVKSPKKLTNQQKRQREDFCRQYVLHRYNGEKAISHSHPHLKNSSTRRSIASRLLTDANIQKRIEEIREEVEQTTGVSKTFMVEELVKLAEKDKQQMVQAFKLIADILGYTQKQAAQVIIQQNNLFGDAEDEFKKSIEL